MEYKSKFRSIGYSLLISVASITLSGCEDSGIKGADKYPGDLNKLNVYTPKTLLRVISVGDDVRSAFAKGVWSVAGEDKIYAPYNVSAINCFKEINGCLVSKAQILPAKGSISATLTISDDFYTAHRWDESLIEASITDRCRLITLKISQNDNTVHEITSYQPNFGTCISTEDKHTQALEAPRLARLITSEEFMAERDAKGI